MSKQIQKRDDYWASFGYAFLAAVIAVPVYFLSRVAVIITATVIFFILMALRARR
jgi:hypothetical protein